MSGQALTTVATANNKRSPTGRSFILGFLKGFFNNQRIMNYETEEGA
jgi:hypothetical protein